MRRVIEKSVSLLSWLASLILICAVTCIVGYLILKGIGALNLKLIFGDTDIIDAMLLKKQVYNGLFPAIFGTIILVLLSVGFAIPIGVASGIYLAEYAGPRSRAVFGFLIDVLASIPSIVIGLFGLSVAILLHKHYSDDIYPCLFFSSISLAFLVLPYIVRSTQISFENIQPETRLTAKALGATRLQNIFYVLFPRSLSGILSGVILAIGRCAEDTAVIMLTGVVAMAGVPNSLFSKYEAIPFYIYYVSSQYRNQEELASGYGAAIILLAICISLFLVAFVVKKQIASRAFYRI